MCGKFGYIIMVSLIVMCAGDFASSWALSIFANSIVGSIPILGDVLILSDIKYLLDAITNDESVEPEQAAAVLLKFLGLIVNVAVWHMFSIVMDGRRYDDGSSNFLIVKFISFVVWTVFYNFLFIKLLYSNVFISLSDIFQSINKLQ